MSTGHVVMLLAGLLGVILTTGVLRNAGDDTAVLVAAEDLVPGTVLDDRAVRLARLDASAEVLGSLVPADAVDDVTGQVVTAAVAEGALLTSDVLAPESSGAAGRAMSIPLPRARALGGALDVGDRVDVLAVAQGGSDAAYVMTDAEVLAVEGDRSGPLGDADELTITLAVDAERALALATALEAGPVTLVRSTGAPPLAADNGNGT
jgi:Flp pilus assembly protein CpaB